MNLFTGEAADELYGGDTSPAVRELLRQARRASAAERPALLWTAQACAPHALPVYYLLAKCHATRRELALAERAVRSGLQEAARQAGLPTDWREVQPSPAFAQGGGPARFWLFMLKAWAFVCTRDGRLDEARALLAKLTELDENAGTGGEVVAALLAASQGTAQAPEVPGPQPPHQPPQAQ